MFPKTRLFGAAVLAGAMLMPALSAAQSPPAAKKDPVPPKEELSGPRDCVHTQDPAGKGVDPKVPEGHSLSQQLAEGQGVICPPPHVDPEMKKPAPGGGVTPVIPPPGSDRDRKGIEPK